MDLVHTEGQLDMPVRVHLALADYHTMFREGLEAILSPREGVEVVGQSSTDEAAAVQIGRTKPEGGRALKNRGREEGLAGAVDRHPRDHPRHRSERIG
jgi:hypothetical protein